MCWHWCAFLVIRILTNVTLYSGRIIVRYMYRTHWANIGRFHRCRFSSRRRQAGGGRRCCRFRRGRREWGERSTGRLNAPYTATRTDCCRYHRRRTGGGGCPGALSGNHRHRTMFITRVSAVCRLDPSMSDSGFVAGFQRLAVPRL